MISLKDALAQMQQVDSKGKPVPFSLEFCTFSRQRHTGGSVVKVERAILSRLDNQIHNKKGTGLSNSSAVPSHFTNKTRNIKLIPSGEIIKFRIRMLLKFNNQPVVY